MGSMCMFTEWPPWPVAGRSAARQTVLAMTVSTDTSGGTRDGRGNSATEDTESELEDVVLAITGGGGLAEKDGHAEERAGVLRLLAGGDSRVRRPFDSAAWTRRRWRLSSETVSSESSSDRSDQGPSAGSTKTGDGVSHTGGGATQVGGGASHSGGGASQAGDGASQVGGGASHSGGGTSQAGGGAVSTGRGASEIQAGGWVNPLRGTSG